MRVKVNDRHYGRHSADKSSVTIVSRSTVGAGNLASLSKRRAPEISGSSRERVDNESLHGYPHIPDGTKHALAA